MKPWLFTLLSFTLVGITFATAHARTTSDTAITISAIVDAYAEWSDPNPVIIATDWSGRFNHTNQSQYVTKTLVLNTNTDAVITPHPGLHNGRLSLQNDTLDTAYQLTGAINDPDRTFKPASQFFNYRNTYKIKHRSGQGTYEINLRVKATTPTHSAPDAGRYTCGLTLIATW